MKSIRIGVLALQGAFREHIEVLDRLGAASIEIRLPRQLKQVDGLIIPGGESTAMFKLIKEYEFEKSLREFNESGKPIFGTCAGLILLVNNINGSLKGLGFIDISADRNAYGRQIESFEDSVELSFDNNAEKARKIKFNAIFIRAPKIKHCGKGVNILGRIGETAVLARSKNILVCAFHPELTSDLSIHRYFLDMVKKTKGEI